jgi:predicted O-linked N-acetylglucosamine transferase (SPINDLY family)
MVTLPGKLMRARHTEAFFKMMGLTDTIAHSVEEYIDIAVQLGLDARRREWFREQIIQNRHKLYGDMECIKGLEAFIESVVERS